MKILIRALVSGVLLGLAISASAQWTWVDKDGRKVFSDRPPPPDVRESNILKRPSAPPPAEANTTPRAASAASAGKSAATLPAPAATEKELAEKLKAADAAEAARKKDEADRVARVKADNCNRAQQARSTYASGVGLSRINAKGEREVIGDAARAAETQRLDSIIATDCR